MSDFNAPLFDVVILKINAGNHQTIFLLPDGHEMVVTDCQSHWTEGARGVLHAGEQEVRFHPYVEQRLRKIGELHPAQTRNGRVGQFIWKLDGSSVRIFCSAQVIPGRDGAYIKDQTVPMEPMGLPPEFIDLCEQRGVPPNSVLRGLIADLCGLQNFMVNPREDGFSSNGSDERMYAQQWFDRAYPEFEDTKFKS